MVAAKTGTPSWQPWVWVVGLTGLVWLAACGAVWGFFGLGPRLAIAAVLATFVLLAVSRLVVEWRIRKVWPQVKKHLNGEKVEGRPVMLAMAVDTVRFAVSWTFLAAVVVGGVAYGILKAKDATTLGPLTGAAAKEFFHSILVVASIVFFIDALLHVCLLIRRSRGRQVIEALASGLTGVTLLILVPIKEAAVMSPDSLQTMAETIWLPVLVVVALIGVIAGLLVLDHRLRISAKRRLP